MLISGREKRRFKTIMDFIKENKWWIIIGFFGTILFCFVNNLIWSNESFGGWFVLIGFSFPIVFSIAILSEFFNKSDGVKSVGQKALLLSFWEFFLYLFLFWICFILIIRGEWRNFGYGTGGFAVMYPLMFLVFSFIPMNLVGGFFIYEIRKIRKGKKLQY